MEELDLMASKLQQRDRDMFHKCITSQLSKDIPRAQVYANECAEIRKIAKIVLTSQLALERVTIRLQTIEEFGEILIQVAPVMDVVRETKGKIAGIIPEVASELESVNTMLHDMSLETGEVDTYESTVGPISDEAVKVLEESGTIAEEMMKEKFPEPKTLVLQEGAEPSGLEDIVVTYIKHKKGKLSLSDCALELGVPLNKIKNIITKLVNEGKIEMAKS
jgi:division protein CdvB (Snf7/Vps24/ESCRT-III family)